VSNRIAFASFFMSMRLCVIVCMFVCYGLMPEINVHSFIHSFIHLLTIITQQESASSNAFNSLLRRTVIRWSLILKDTVGLMVGLYLIGKLFYKIL